MQTDSIKAKYLINGLTGALVILLAFILACSADDAAAPAQPQQPAEAAPAQAAVAAQDIVEQPKTPKQPYPAVPATKAKDALPSLPRVESAAPVLAATPRRYVPTVTAGGNPVFGGIAIGIPQANIAALDGQVISARTTRYPAINTQETTMGRDLNWDIKPMLADN